MVKKPSIISFLHIINYNVRKCNKKKFEGCRVVPGFPVDGHICSD